MAPTCVVVELPARPYSIHIGPQTLATAGELVPPARAGQIAAVVADETTGALFGEKLLTGLEGGGWRPHLVAIPPGEQSKTLAMAGEVHGRLADLGLDRGSAVFALGGGVVGDLGGFVAATYMRGIDFITVPTTLLAQVDSSVGGKVGVDLPQAKNLVGAFHQPRAVLIDPGTLTSLPERQFAAGLAEVVKHAAIADAALFDDLNRSAEAVLAREPERLAEIVARNCEIKAAVVVQDPEERSGLRAVLNYGHTIGHAVERGAAAWGVLHGEAVAAGLVAESRIAARRGLSDEAVPRRLEGLLRALHVPTTVAQSQIDPALAARALRTDKKLVGGSLLLPVVPALGRVELTRALSVDDLADEMESLLQ